MKIIFHGNNAYDDGAELFTRRKYEPYIQYSHDFERLFVGEIRNERGREILNAKVGTGNGVG